MEREVLVIDASIAVKWFNKEEYSDVADKFSSKVSNLNVKHISVISI